MEPPKSNTEIIGEAVHLRSACSSGCALKRLRAPGAGIGGGRRVTQGDDSRDEYLKVNLFTTMEDA